MADTATYGSYGWAGSIVRVNLTDGTISVESDEAMQEDYIGGMGFANKIMYDEVPAHRLRCASGRPLHLGDPLYVHDRLPGC